MNQINEKVVRKVLATIDAGLCHGLGKPEPGKMCVMAAINYAMGNPHGDKPSCVHPVVRAFDIKLNDSRWSSNEARADGMRREAIAKLGSTGIDGNMFRDLVVIGTTQKVVPIALRAVAKMIPKAADKLETAAVACEMVVTKAQATIANNSAVKVAREARQYAAVYAADAAADAAYAAAYAAVYAADAAAYAADASGHTDQKDNIRDEILSLSAAIACSALIACGSEGSKYLYLCDETQ